MKEREQHLDPHIFWWVGLLALVDRLRPLMELHRPILNTQWASCPRCQTYPKCQGMCMQILYGFSGFLGVVLKSPDQWNMGWIKTWWDVVTCYNCYMYSTVHTSEEWGWHNMEIHESLLGHSHHTHTYVVLHMSCIIILKHSTMPHYQITCVTEWRAPSLTKTLNVIQHWQSSI